MPIGMHFSIAGGLDRAVDRAAALGCDCLQIFVSNPRGWAFSGVSEADAARFKEKRRSSGIVSVAVHVPYLVNISSDTDEVFDKSINRLRAELKAANDIGADFLVTHLGSPRSEGAQFALRRVLKALSSVCISKGKTRLLLENTSGSGTGFGADLSVIGGIIRSAREKGVDAGICIDTCHAFAAGYDLLSKKGIEALFKAVKGACGLEAVKLVHLNDSKGALGSRLDRHEFLGKGKIGEAGLANFLRHAAIRKLPIILETPKININDDPQNLAIARRLMDGGRIKS